MIVAMGDVHLDPATPPDPSYLAVKRFIKDVRPSKIVILGDFGDFACFSSHDYQKRLLMEGRRYAASCERVRLELEELRPYCSQMYYIMGNHEYRVQRYIEMHPELDGALDLERDLWLEALHIQAVPYNEVLNLGKLNFTHGWAINKYHAAKMAQEFGDNIIYGHTHTYQAYTPHYRVDREPYLAMSVGCLCSRNPDYLKNLPNRWINGFALIEVRGDGNFNAHWVAIIDGEFTLLGRTWKSNGEGKS